VIDAGCGSGILAISAAKLGCRRVVAFDVDREAVTVARRNVRCNSVSGAVRVLTGGLHPMPRAANGADLVLANIQADVLLAHVRDLLGAVAPGGELVLSGILGRECPAVRDAFVRAAGPGWRVRSRRLGEWADVVLRRPADS
jgi:ribosomal protein L11 methyltransferase